MYIKIVDHPNLVRDSESRAVLNIDREGKKNFLKAREDKRKERARIDILEQNVHELNEKLDTILDLLRFK